MFNSMLRYDRLCKLKKQHIRKQLAKEVLDIQNSYTTKQIKHWWRTDSLSSDMQDIFMACRNDWDSKDIRYKAGQIVLFCNHVFNNHTIDKWAIYQIMKDMGIEFDTLMTIDYLRAKCRAKKHKSWVNNSRPTCFSDTYEIDNNFEVKLQENLWYLWYRHTVGVIVGLVSVIVLLVGLIVFKRYRED